MKRATLNIHVIILILFLISPDKFHGQNCAIKGFIYDANTRKPLKMVNVSVEPGRNGALTDEEGFYVISRLQEGEFTVKAFCIGYDTAVMKASLVKNETLVLNINLLPSTYELDEVIVSGTREKIAMRKISEISMNPSEINLTPSVGGMSDIMQHIQTIPGVVTRGDIGGQVYIRGGTPVQTKIFLDESVIYNPVHSIGLFSVFDNDCLRNADFYTGGFAAEYGGCLSSVIDITSKSPNSVDWSGKIDLSTIASKLLIEGPVIKDSTSEKTSLSVLFSMKASHFERANEWFYAYLDQELPFYFRDIFAKTTLKCGKGFNVNISGYNFKDRVSETSTFKTYGWNSGGFSLNMMILPPSVPILIKTYIAGSYYDMTLDEPNYDSRFSKVSSISSGMKFYRYLNRQTVKYGFDFTDLRTSYRYYTNNYNNYEQEENSGELSGFIDYQGNFGRWVLEAGFRGAYYTSLMKFSPEPRLSVKFLIRENLAIKAATGMYTQNLVGAISDKDIVNFFQGYLSAPVDMVSTSGQDPDDFYLQKASHLVAGLEYDFRDKLFFDLEAYYKNYTQLINFNKNMLIDGNDFSDAPSYMNGVFISETGFAEGIEITAEYAANNLKLEVNYSFAIVKRRYLDPEEVIVEYYPQYDRRHNLNLMGVYAMGKKRSWVATARWNYGSGFPFTPSGGYYEGIVIDESGNLNYLDQNGQMSILYGPYNSKRLPAYHRLDIAIKKTFSFSKRSIIETEFSIINVYNRENIFYINRNTNKEASQLPILPSLRVSCSF
jgi:hypothetical protein